MPGRMKGNARQEEEFVPFRLPPLPQQAQEISLPMEETTPVVALAASSPHA